MMPEHREEGASLKDTQALVAMSDPEKNKPDGTVLIIDDEESLANMVARILVRSLHIEKEKIAVCYSVRDAIIRLEAGQSPSLVMSDVRMPGETGMDFYEDYLKTRPQIIARTLFMTGGAGGSERLEQFIGKVSQRGRCIAKPFSVQDLIGKVTEILDQQK